MTQLRKLATPFPKHYIEKKPGSYDADYVAHHVVTQALIAALRQVPRQTVVREIYDGDVLSGVVLRLEVDIDGRPVTVEEAGVSSNSQSKDNGSRLKDAISDAYKRCAMRMGLGLHLWAQGHYFLDRSLDRDPADG